MRTLSKQLADVLLQAVKTRVYNQPKYKKQGLFNYYNHHTMIIRNHYICFTHSLVDYEVKHLTPECSLIQLVSDPLQLVKEWLPIAFL